MEQPPVCTTPRCVNENITRTDLSKLQKLGQGSRGFHLQLLSSTIGLRLAFLCTSCGPLHCTLRKSWNISSTFWQRHDWTPWNNLVPQTPSQSIVCFWKLLLRHLGIQCHTTRFCCPKCLNSWGYDTPSALVFSLRLSLNLMNMSWWETSLKLPGKSAWYTQSIVLKEHVWMKLFYKDLLNNFFSVHPPLPSSLAVLLRTHLWLSPPGHL